MSFDQNRLGAIRESAALSRPLHTYSTTACVIRWGEARVKHLLSSVTVAVRVNTYGLCNLFCHMSTIYLRTMFAHQTFTL